jgi:lipoate-protein ligase A
LLVRESGGGAVLAGPWLVSASLVLPHGHPWLRDGLIDSYRRLGQLHATVLSEFGVPARALPPHELPRAHEAGAARTVEWACFGSLSPWEVVNAEGRKLVGLAQRRRQAGVLLVAGTLVGAVDWPLLCEAMGQPQDETLLRQRTVSCEEQAGPPIAPEQFARALAQQLERSLAEPATACLTDTDTQA